MNQQPDTPERLTALRNQILACCNDDELRKAVAERASVDGGYPFDVL